MLAGMYATRRQSRHRSTTLAIGVLFALLIALPAAHARAQTTDPPGLDVVRGAYDELQDNFYRPLDPVALLNAGWSGLAAALQQASSPPPAPLPQLPADRAAAFSAFATAYAGYVANLPPRVTALNVAFTIVDRMARSLQDSHTGFLSPANYRAFLASLAGNQRPVGPGIRATTQPPWIVTEVAPGGPADTAGLQPGDVITAVNGKDVTGATRAQLQQALAGDTGTVVAIVADRDGDSFDVTVTNGPYFFPVLRSRLLPDGSGYIRLDQFVQPNQPLADGTKVLDDLDARLDDLEAAGARGLILDLRNNSGGDTSTAAELLGRFLPEDATTVIRFDERGHRSVGIVSGEMRAVQLPLAVLVNGGSASSSEVTASTLREAGRAILVGRRTAGALATAETFALPENAGMEIARAEQLTSRDQVKIEGTGFPVDVDVADTRTAADHREGHDPQLDAAVAALDQAPPPAAFHSSTLLATDQVHALLSGLAPDPSLIPTNSRLTTVQAVGDRDLNHPDEYIGLGSRDPLALLATVRARGWEGERLQIYAPDAFRGPRVYLTIDAYASAAGAANAVATNDFPDLQQPIDAPLQIGDRTAAYRGVWLQSGLPSITWQRGNIVLTVSYTGGGADALSYLAQVVRAVDANYGKLPLPAPLAA